MARIRTIKPEFPQSESMGRVSREARLCFILLWTVADDSGRLRGNSRMLASLLYPYDDDAGKHIEKWLTELTSEGCIARYEVDGMSYIQVLNWAKHQKIDKPSGAKFPAFDESSRELAKPREVSSGDQGPRTKEGKGGEGTDSAVPQSATPPVVALPLIDGTEYPVTEAEVSAWSQTYPAVDVVQQLREMRAWCTANPANRKTRRGVCAFAVKWLGREQDKAPRVVGQGGPAPGAADPDSQPAVEAEGERLGLGRWSQTEQWPAYKARVRQAQRAGLGGAA